MIFWQFALAWWHDLVAATMVRVAMLHDAAFPTLAPPERPPFDLAAYLDRDAAIPQEGMAGVSILGVADCVLIGIRTPCGGYAGATSLGASQAELLGVALLRQAKRIREHAERTTLADVIERAGGVRR